MQYGYDVAAEIVKQNDEVAKLAAVQQLKLIINHMQKEDTGTMIRRWQLNTVHVANTSSFSELSREAKVAIAAIDSEIVKTAEKAKAKMLSLSEADANAEAEAEAAEAAFLGALQPTDATLVTPHSAAIASAQSVTPVDDSASTDTLEVLGSLQSDTSARARATVRIASVKAAQKNGETLQDLQSTALESVRGLTRCEKTLSALQSSVWTSSRISKGQKDPIVAAAHQDFLVIAEEALTPEKQRLSPPTTPLSLSMSPIIGKSTPMLTRGAAAYLRQSEPAEGFAPSMTDIKAIIHDAALNSKNVERVAALDNSVFTKAIAEVSYSEQKRLRAALREARRSRLSPSPARPPPASFIK